MKLYFTPLSHFSRKVRIVADFYKLDVDYIDVGNVAEIGVEKYALNPLMGVPVLVDQDLWMIDSDNIVSYLVNRYDPKDQLNFSTKDIEKLNIRSVLNGLMSNEVKLVLGRRTGISVEGYTYFQKSKKSIEQCLSWLESKAESFSSEKITFQEIHLICALDHIKYFETVDMSPYKKICGVIDSLSGQEFIQRSNPFVLRPK